MTGYGNPLRIILFTIFPPELTVYQHTHRKAIRIPSLTGVRSAEAIFPYDELPVCVCLAAWRVKADRLYGQVANDECLRPVK